MKTTTVPAQVTTVEDKIAGNLTLSQLLLLITPLFVGSIIYVIVPRPMHLSIIKAALSFLILVICGMLAIRIKGKIVLFWLITVLRYALRPRYYIYNKNDLYLRESEELKWTPIQQASEEPPEIAEATSLTPVAEMTPIQRLRLENAMADPRSKLHFIANRRGGLRVHITEVK